MTCACLSWFAFTSFVILQQILMLYTKNANNSPFLLFSSLCRFLAIYIWFLLRRNKPVLYVNITVSTTMHWLLLYICVISPFVTSSKPRPLFCLWKEKEKTRLWGLFTCKYVSSTDTSKLGRLLWALPTSVRTWALGRRSISTKGSNFEGCFPCRQPSTVDVKVPCTQLSDSVFFWFVFVS